MIPGWFDYADLYYRIAEDAPPGAKLVEVGVWQGKSFVFLVQALRGFNKNAATYAVDLFDGTGGTPEMKAEVAAAGGSLFDTFLRNLELSGITKDDAVTVIQGDSAESAKPFPDGSLYFVFIDAGHEFDDVVRDIKAWLPKISSGGVLAGHDISYPPVESAVRDALGSNWSRDGSCWIHHQVK